MGSEEFFKLAENLEDLADNIQESIDDELEDEIKNIKIDAQINILDNGSTYKYRLINSLTTDIVNESNTKTIYRVRSRGNIAPHNWYVEMGTGIKTNNRLVSRIENEAQTQLPFDAPKNVSGEFIDNILQWVEMKGITPIEYSTSFGVATAIAYSIVDTGTPSKPFMYPAFRDHRRHIMKRIEKAVEKELKKL